MYTHYTYLLTPVVSSLTTADVINRRGLRFRPARVDPADTPTPPTAHSWGDDVPYAGGTTPRLGHDVLQPATPEYQPAAQPNKCLREICAELTQEIAREAIEQLMNNLGGSSSTSTTTQRFPSPIATAYATRSLIPNHHVAKTMTLDQESFALFNDDEQDMYYQDRMCFYANVEQRYASAATASPTPSPLTRRDDGIDAIQSAETASPTPLLLADAAHYQQPLWNTYMPNNLLSIYALATANHSISTATITCSGLGGSPSITLSYVQARASAQSPTPTVTNENMSECAANVQAQVGRPAIFGAVLAILGLVVL